MTTRVLDPCIFLAGAISAAGLAAEPKITADVIYGHKDGMALTYDVFEATNPNGAGVIYTAFATLNAALELPRPWLPGSRNISIRSRLVAIEPIKSCRIRPYFLS